MKATIILMVLVLAGCACFPKALDTEGLSIGMSYQAVMELEAEPYSEIHTTEPGHVIKVLKYTGGTVLTFRDDVLIEIERRL